MEVGYVLEEGINVTDFPASAVLVIRFFCKYNVI